MKFYIASKFEDQEKVNKMQEKVRTAGHEIIEDWTQHKNIPEYSKNQSLSAQYASEDVEGAKNCDIFILVANESSRGSHLELGAALASEKPSIYVIGEKRDDYLFYFHEKVNRKENLESVLEDLD